MSPECKHQEWASRVCQNHSKHSDRIIVYTGVPYAFLSAIQEGVVRTFQMQTTSSEIKQESSCDGCEWDNVCSLEFISYDPENETVLGRDAKGDDFEISLGSVVSFEEYED